jgi:hypothetical protein
VFKALNLWQPKQTKILGPGKMAFPALQDSELDHMFPMAGSHPKMRARQARHLPQYIIKVVSKCRDQHKYFSAILKNNNLMQKKIQNE